MVIEGGDAGWLGKNNWPQLLQVGTWNFPIIGSVWEKKIQQIWLVRLVIF
jgi:hypothetical protein